MTKLLRAGLVALLGIALAAPAALAGKTSGATYHGKMTVDDKAGVFSAEGIRSAEALFDGVTFKAKTHLTVVTMSSVPADKKQDLDATKGDKAKASSFFGKWARELANQHGEKGVFVLVYSEGERFFVKTVADEQTDVFRSFNDKDATQVEQKLVAAFRDAKTKTGDQAKHTRDEGLKQAAQVVVEELKDTTVPTGHSTSGGSTAQSSSDTPHKPGMPWWGWAIIIVGILLFIWIIVAVIRATTGNVYGPGYGGYYYGGGGWGGGFWPCFMGGMFGTMAGMWMYNSFFGGHMYYDSGMAAAGTYPEGGYNPDAGDAGAGNFDGGSEGAGDGDWDGGGDAGGDGGGGDWGNDAGGDTGGGDWGNDGGGGDWGGGDTGGGGDWGGGGGDFGGGGGDW